MHDYSAKPASLTGQQCDLIGPYLTLSCRLQNQIRDDVGLGNE